VGAANAGKTLYYYLLNADNTLTFQQTSVVDNTGWATVTQTHASDYVFLSRDINSISPSPSVSPTPAASESPLPSPSTSPDKGSSIGSDGWFIAAIILIAVALIVGGIWLYIKNREDKLEDEEDEDDNKLF
jgi:hypothetical protein